MKTIRGETGRTIVQKSDPILRKTTKPVPEKLFGSEELSRLMRDMAEILDAEPDGVALAAPQVGVPWRIFIVRKDRTAPPKPAALRAAGSGELTVKHEMLTPNIEVYINPEIIRHSRKYQKADEGCLSIRGVYGKTRRHERATIRAREESGKRFERGAGGLMAQIFEHEIDHLNGILFTDHATNVVETKHLSDETA